MNDSDKLDLFYRNLMLILGIISAVLFLLSLVALIQFPSSFKFLALGMVVTTLAFFILRSVYSFRSTFKVRAKNKATRK